MRVADFDYHLPEERIAQHPPEQRDGGRLLLLRRETGEISHHHIADLPDLMPERALAVANNSRVIPARVQARRASGGKVELFLLEKLQHNEINSDFHGVSSGESQDQGREFWRCMARASKRLKLGERLALLGSGGGDAPQAEVRVEAEVQGGRTVVSAARDRLLDHGSVPLPPYIKRSPAEGDLRRYQTVYAEPEGSVAAPTAGLHFTPELLRRVRRRGVKWATVTLHVGPGTFVPVRAEAVEDHRMEHERYVVPESTASAVATARAEKRPVVAIGTTSVRTLEGSGGLAGAGRTDLFITPGYRFRVVDGLLTNFHLPRSTLLMLVSALGGRERVLAAYREAVARSYRFYSYGDAMLLI